MVRGRQPSAAAAIPTVASLPGEVDNSSPETPKTPGIGFANLTRAVAAKWQALPESEKAPFTEAAAKEKARYQAQMVVWRARQEQKKALKTGSPQQHPSMDVVTSELGMQSSPQQQQQQQQQSRGGHLGRGTSQVDYPESWFQASESSAASGEGLESALHFMGIREQQQRAMLAQQQLQQLQHLQQMQQNMLTVGYHEPLFTGFAQRQYSLGPQQGPTSSNTGLDLSMRHMGGQMDINPHPFMMLQEPQLSRPLETEERKQETKLADTPAKPSSLWPRNQSRRSSAPNFELRPDFSPGRRPNIPLRAAMSNSGGVGATRARFQQRQEHEPGEEAQHRMPRSRSLPGLSPRAPTSPQEASLPRQLPRLLMGNLEAGMETPMTPLQAPMRLPFHRQPLSQAPLQSPHSHSLSILNSPNMVPTPPRNNNEAFTNSPKDGFDIPRPLSEPPPTFPGDEEFQSTETVRALLRRRQSQPNSSPQQEEAGMVGNIRSCEEMAAEMNQLSSTRRSSLIESTFEALESNIDDDGVDFLANLQFEEE